MNEREQSANELMEAWKSGGIRGRSGAVNSTDPLVTFLYILMRDYLPAGQVEKLMKEHVEPTAGDVSHFSNGWVAMHAIDVAGRLLGRTGAWEGAKTSFRTWMPMSDGELKHFLAGDRVQRFESGGSLDRPTAFRLLATLALHVEDELVWEIGDRVTRKLFMDDGTWDQQGDGCLFRSPLRHGEITAIEADDHGVTVYHVLWDRTPDRPPSTRRYYGHGFDREGTP